MLKKQDERRWRKSKVQSPRSKVQGPRSKVQGPRSRLRTTRFWCACCKSLGILRNTSPTSQLWTLDFWTLSPLGAREPLVELCVHAPPGDELLVGAAFDDVSVFEHKHQLGMADGAQPVRDDERGTARQQNR